MTQEKEIPKWYHDLKSVPLYSTLLDNLISNPNHRIARIAIESSIKFPSTIKVNSITNLFKSILNNSNVHKNKIDKSRAVTKSNIIYNRSLIFRDPHQSSQTQQEAPPFQGTMHRLRLDYASRYVHRTERYRGTQYISERNFEISTEDLLRALHCGYYEDSGYVMHEEAAELGHALLNWEDDQNGVNMEYIDQEITDTEDHEVDTNITNYLTPAKVQELYDEDPQLWNNIMGQNTVTNINNWLSEY